MKNLSFLLILTLLLSPSAFAFGKKRVAVDAVTDASILDGDATGLAEGCGQQPSPLGMFCRLVEGDVVATSVFFIGPPAKCDREACVFVKVWNNQGQLVFGGSIPKGQTRIEVPWKTLLGRDHVEIGDRGTWAFNTTVFFIDKDGRERDSTSTGDIILRIFRKSYVPLHNVEDDPNFVWEWVDGNFQYKMTTGLRAFVKRVK